MVKHDDQAIRDRVIEELETLGTTNREIGTKLGVDPTCVRFWHDGLAVPKAHNLAKFHAAGLDIFYIITGKRVGDIIAKTCHNCRHYHDCDDHNCDQDCAACDHNACRNCANQSNWLWEGYTHAKN